MCLVQLFFLLQFSFVIFWCKYIGAQDVSNFVFLHFPNFCCALSACNLRKKLITTNCPRSTDITEKLCNNKDVKCSVVLAPEELLEPFSTLTYSVSLNFFGKKKVIKAARKMLIKLTKARRSRL